MIYLLAAGHGRRAGGPKAWLDCEGKSLLERQLDFVCGLKDARPVVAVQKGWLARCAELGYPARWVDVDPDAAPIASLQSLLKAFPAGGLVWHVDMRVWEPALIETMREAGGTAVPVCRGRRGHPVSLSAADAAAVLELPPATGRLDRFLRGRAREIEVPYECALDNWNDGR